MLVLEEIFKSKKSAHSDAFNLRIHRGLSWLKKAVLLEDDLELKFISAWIGFNAIYAQEMGSVQDKNTFGQFLDQIYRLDQEHKLDHLVWNKFSDSIRLMVENPYMLQKFWDCQNQKISQNEWKQQFEFEKTQVQQALHCKDTVALLLITFNRLYTLHQQMIQGGATYHSAVNRKSLEYGCNILIAVLPVCMYVLLENAQRFDLAQPFYPVVQMS